MANKYYAIVETPIVKPNDLAGKILDSITQNPFLTILNAKVRTLGLIGNENSVKVLYEITSHSNILEALKKRATDVYVSVIH